MFIAIICGEVERLITENNETVCWAVCLCHILCVCTNLSLTNAVVVRVIRYLV